MAKLWRDNRERWNLEIGQSTGSQIVGPMSLATFGYRWKHRLTVVLSGATLGADVASVQVQAALPHDEEDDPVWYSASAAVAIQTGSNTALVFDDLVVGTQVRLLVVFARASQSPVIVEVVQS